MEKLHIMYRMYGGDKPEIRPDFYSKELCLRSIMVALKAASNWTFTLYYDGTAPLALVAMLKDFGGRVVNLGGLGNSEAFRVVYEKALDKSKDDWVYFVEDDYLHKPNAIIGLLEAIILNKFEYGNYLKSIMEAKLDAV